MEAIVTARTEDPFPKSASGKSGKNTKQEGGRLVLAVHLIEFLWVFSSSFQSLLLLSMLPAGF
jgi:hypothetical protein